MSDTLSELRICVQKPLPHEEKELETLQNASNSGYHFEKLRAAFFTKKLWPNNSTIKISFNPSYSKSKTAHWTPLSTLESQRQNDGSALKIDPIEYEIRKLTPEKAVEKIVKERIQPIVNLKFKFVESNGDVRISFDPKKGAYSLLGIDCKDSKEEATMNLGWLDAGTIIHEFGHVLGMIHEHQNQKGKSIDWDKEEVYKWANETQGWDKDTTYHNILQKYDHNQLNASDFDPQSVMLYFFPPQLTNNNEGTNNNHTLSREDVVYISKIYPGGKMSPNEFYEYAYGESISGSIFSMKNIFIVFLILVLIFIIFLVVRFSLKKRKTSDNTTYRDYSQWKKSNG